MCIMKTESFIINKTQQGANVTASKGNSKGNVMITTKSGVVMFIHPSLLDEAKNSKFVSYEPAGSSFVANRDSKRTKGQVWLQANEGKDISTSGLGDKADEALYFTGETVKRLGNNFSGFTNNNEIEFADKVAILKAAGVTFSL